MIRFEIRAEITTQIKEFKAKTIELKEKPLKEYGHMLLQYITKQRGQNEISYLNFLPDSQNWIMLKTKLMFTTYRTTGACIFQNNMIFVRKIEKAIDMF